MYGGNNFIMTERAILNSLNVANSDSSSFATGNSSDRKMVEADEVLL